MNIMLLSTSTLLLISMTMLIMAFMLNNRSNSDRDKLSPFECGFDPKSSARTPFSMRFFLLAIIFIVFDIEIVLLMPTPLLMNSKMSSVMMITFIFLFILTIGLLHEWMEGSLDWSS